MADSSTSSPAVRPRPRIVGRSVSDFSPLSDPSASSHIDNEAGGRAPSTHAYVAGTKVVSGGKLATGGLAPFSPFLPLPPAPSIEELKLRQLDLNDLTPVSDAGSTPSLNIGAFSSNTRANEVQQHNASVREEENDSAPSGGSPPKKQKRLAMFNNHLDEPNEDLSNRYGASFHTRLHRHSEGMSRAQGRSSSCMMVRSYSLPVATQAEFDRQTKLKSWSSTARVHDQSNVWGVARSSPLSKSADSSNEDDSSSMRRTFSSQANAQEQEESSHLSFSTSSPKRKMQDMSALRTPTSSSRPALAPVSMNTPRSLGEAFQMSPPRNSDDASSEEKASLAPVDQHNSPRWLPALSPPCKLEDGYTSDDTEDSGACTPRAGSPSYEKASYYISQLTMSEPEEHEASAAAAAKNGQQSASAWHDLIDFIHPDHL